MKEISEKINIKLTIVIVSLIIMSEIVAALIKSDYFWPVIISVLVFLWAIYVSVKLKQVCMSGNSIFIKDKQEFVEVPISNINPNITSTIFIGGAYRINFIKSTKYGKSILFLPKRKWFLKLSEATKSLLEKVNT